MMNGREKSVPVVVAVKSMNEAGQPGEEWMEPRAGAKGNVGRLITLRTQCRAGVSHALGHIRHAAVVAKPSDTRGGSRMRESRTYRLCAGGA
jgi:RNA-directed DNA polymerase